MTARDDARAAIRTATFRLVGDTAAGTGLGENFKPGTGEGFEIAPIYHGSTVTERRPLPRPALRAGIELLYAATRALRTTIGQARTAGIGWQDIADDLGFTAAAEEGYDAARDAWRFAASGLLPGQAPRTVDAFGRHSPSISWRCGTCGGLVTEHDIDDGLNAQRGHDSGCTRLAAELAANRATWND